MSRSKGRTEAILEFIRDEVTQLGRYLILLEMLDSDQAMKDSSPQAALTTIRQAVWMSLLIGLAGLISTDSESITLQYLIDHANNHPYDYDDVSSDQVGRAVEEAMRQIRALEQAEIRLRVLRDRRLAHIDRKHINDPESMRTLRFSKEEAVEVLMQIESILNRFHKLYFSESVPFEAFRSSMKTECDELFAVMSGSEAL